MIVINKDNNYNNCIVVLSLECWHLTFVDGQVDGLNGCVEQFEGEINCEPRIHMMADFSNEKFSRLLSQCSVEL